ncbi:MAG TPA: hypothetical protein VIJ76_01950 [Galbitalea sp.]
MAGVAAWGRVAPFVWRDRLPHVVMVAVMAYTMLGERSPLKCLVGAAVLIAASVAMAPLARWSAAYRGHVLDFWAMALSMLALLPHSALAAGEHAHSALSLGGVTAFLGVSAVWFGARVVVAVAGRDGRAPASLLSVALTAVGLALTLAFCS